MHTYKYIYIFIIYFYIHTYIYYYSYIYIEREYRLVAWNWQTPTRTLCQLGLLKCDFDSKLGCPFSSIEFEMNIHLGAKVFELGSIFDSLKVCLIPRLDRSARPGQLRVGMTLRFACCWLHVRFFRRNLMKTSFNVIAMVGSEWWSCIQPVNCFVLEALLPASDISLLVQMNLCCSK